MRGRWSSSAEGNEISNRKRGEWQVKILRKGRAKRTDAGQVWRDAPKDNKVGKIINET